MVSRTHNTKLIKSNEHPQLNDINLTLHKLGNFLHSILLLAGMIIVLSLLGWLFAGPSGMKWVLITGAISLILSPSLSPQIILKWYGARPISQAQSPALYSALRELSRRANLANVPKLYHVPTSMLNAFTTGNRNNAAIAMTDGLLRALDTRELVAVLAHETSHLKNNDLWIMNLSDILSRLTSFLSTAGQLLLIFNLPLWLVSGYQISWIAILVLIFAPLLTVFLQLALSRTRAFDADLGAAALTGDPQGLASALFKMERYQGGLLARIFLPGHREPHPSILRTHPQTEAHIKRLLSLSKQKPEISPLPHLLEENVFNIPEHMTQIRNKPRWRIGGIWY